MDGKVRISTETAARYIHDCFVSCLRLTNKNLLHLDERIAKSNDVKGRAYRPLYISEATSIFKGNFIRLLKTIYDSTTMNRLKSVMLFKVKLDGVHPIVESVELMTDTEFKFIPATIRKDLKEIKDVIDNIMDAEYEREAYAATREYMDEKAHKFTHMLSSPEPKKIAEINFDSIKKIKFE